jgi:MFS family permease
VRRLAPRFGEKRVAIAGVILVTAGLFGLAPDAGSALFWASLTLLAFGSGAAFPTFAALVSLHVAEEAQGEALGAFRALGSLARAVGPFAAAILYWRYGPAVPYAGAAALLALPLILLAGVPRPEVGAGEKVTARNPSHSTEDPR